MTLRLKRGEDLSLYAFAKKYQENQNSSELVKKQNATEEKVLSAKLEYINNQQCLTMKTLEKEINMIKKRAISSHHFDRAFLPNTPRKWNKHNFSPAKFVNRNCLTKPFSRRQLLPMGNTKRWNVDNTCDYEQSQRNTIPTTIEGNEIINEEKPLCLTMAAAESLITTHKSFLHGKENDLQRNKHKTCSNHQNTCYKTINRFLPSWSRYYSKDHDKNRRISWKKAYDVNHSIMINSNMTYSHNDIFIDGSLQDGRFKNLESVLIPS